MAVRKSNRKVRSDVRIFTKKEIHQIESLCGVGFTIEQVADYLGCSKATLDRRIAEYPEVAESVRKGRTRAHAQVCKAAYDMAVDKKHSDFTKFYLKSRYGWSERTDVHLTQGDEPVNPEHKFMDAIKSMSTDELEAFVEQGRKQTE